MPLAPTFSIESYSAAVRDFLPYPMAGERLRETWLLCTLISSSPKHRFGEKQRKSTDNLQIAKHITRQDWIPMDSEKNFVASPFRNYVTFPHISLIQSSK